MSMIFTAIKIDPTLDDPTNIGFLNNNSVGVLAAPDMTTLKDAVRNRIARFKDEVWLLSSPQQVGQIKAVDLPPVKFDPAA